MSGLGMTATASSRVAGSKYMGGLEADIHKVAERKRMEADKVRFELNNALKELYELQSQCMALEREVQIVHDQLPVKTEPVKSSGESGKPATVGSAFNASSRRPAGGPASSPPRSAPSTTHGTSPHRPGSMMEAIYATDAIKRMVQELEGIHADTAVAAYQGKVYDHMRRRLAEEVVGERRRARELQDKVTAERTKNNDLHRRELEVGRQLGVVQGRLLQMRKDVDGQLNHWRTEVRERRAFVAKRKEFVVYLEGQIAAARRGSGMVMHAAPPSAAVVSDDTLARAPSFDASAGHAAMFGSTSVDKKRTAAALLSSRSITRRLSRNVATLETEDSRYTVALRMLGLKLPESMVEGSDAGRPPSATGTLAPQSSRSRASHTSGMFTSLRDGPMPLPSVRSTHSAALKPGQLPRWPSATIRERSAAAFDVNFIVKACIQQDEVRRQLLDRLHAEEARIGVLQRRLVELHAPVRAATAQHADREGAVSDMLRGGGAHDPSADDRRTPNNVLGGDAVGSRAGTRGDTGRRSPLPVEAADDEPRDAETASRPTNRELATKENLLADAEKKLQLVQSEHDFLMGSITPVRVGIAAMARKLLDGAGATLADPTEAHTVLARLGAKCAAMVDEIRKVVAMNDPEGGGADWSTLQADELAAAMDAAATKTPDLLVHRTTLVQAAREAANAAYLSPYNMRVAPSTSHGTRQKAKIGALPAYGFAGTTVDDNPDAEERDGADEGADGDEDAEVMNRGELKKMSQKLVKYRRRIDRTALSADAKPSTSPTSDDASPANRGASRQAGGGPRGSIAAEHIAATARSSAADATGALASSRRMA